MASFNKVILMGNITADPELKQTISGKSVTSFNIAINGRGTEAQTHFITVVAWQSTAEFICRYFKRGNPIHICGRLETRQWTDKNNNKRTEVEVIAEEVAFVANKAETTPFAAADNNLANNATYEELPDEPLPF